MHMTRRDFIDTLKEKEQFILSEKCTEPQKNIEELCDFIESIELSKKDKENLAFDSDRIQEIITSAKEFIRGESFNQGVISMKEFRQYRANLENLMSILNDILPYNYYVSEKEDKILAKRIMPAWDD